MKNYNRNEFNQLMKLNGYILDKSCRGKHLIYTNGTYRIAVPNHPKLSGVTTMRIIKQYKLNV